MATQTPTKREGAPAQGSSRGAREQALSNAVAQFRSLQEQVLSAQASLDKQITEARAAAVRERQQVVEAKGPVIAQQNVIDGKLKELTAERAKLQPLLERLEKEEKEAVAHEARLAALLDIKAASAPASKPAAVVVPMEKKPAQPVKAPPAPVRRGIFSRAA